MAGFLSTKARFFVHLVLCLSNMLLQSFGILKEKRPTVSSLLKSVDSFSILAENYSSTNILWNRFCSFLLLQTVANKPPITKKAICQTLNPPLISNPQGLLGIWLATLNWAEFFDSTMILLDCAARRAFGDVLGCCFIIVILSAKPFPQYLKTSAYIWHTRPQKKAKTLVSSHTANPQFSHSGWIKAVFKFKHLINAFPHISFGAPFNRLRDELRIKFWDCLAFSR